MNTKNTVYQLRRYPIHSALLSPDSYRYRFEILSVDNRYESIKYHHCRCINVIILFKCVIVKRRVELYKRVLMMFQS
jgi:hypothetical protein